MALSIEELNGTNCKSYLLVSGKHAALVDPVRERVETYRHVLSERGLELALVLETHTHADHLMLNHELKRALGAKVVMHRESPSPLVDRHISDGDVIEIGQDSIKVLHTPGHTPDSVSLLTEKAVLTGDVLLIGGSGRTDFPGGDPGASYDSVTERLFVLPDDMEVLPAHDYKGQKSSTIGREKRQNPRFLDKSRSAYVEMMSLLGLPLPDRLQQALQVNQSGFEADEISFPMVADLLHIRSIGADELASRLAGKSPPLVIDVREPEEFVGDLGHIEGALLVPLDVLERRLPKLHGYADRELCVVCRAGARSASACAMLSRAGFGHVVNLTGGMLAWNERRLDTQR